MLYPATLLKSAIGILFLLLTLVNAAAPGTARGLAPNLIPIIEFEELYYAITTDVLSTNSGAGYFLSKPIFLGSSYQTVQIFNITAQFGVHRRIYTSLVQSFATPLKLSRNGTSVNSGPVTFKWVNPGGVAQSINDGLIDSTNMDLLSSTISISVTPVNSTITGSKNPIFYTLHDVQSNVKTVWNTSTLSA